MSDQTRLLLDKNVVRRYFEGVTSLARELPIGEEEQQAILLVHLAQRRGSACLSRSRHLICFRRTVAK